MNKLLSYFFGVLMILLTVGVASSVNEAMLNNEFINSPRPQNIVIDPLFAPLAIGFDKGWYAPGETVLATFQVGVPCNTNYVRFYVNQGSKNYFYESSSTPGSKLASLSQCSSAYVQFVFSAPSVEGTFEALLSFVDGAGNVIYYDQAFFTVSLSNPSCGSDYCGSWEDVIDLAHGVVQQKACYSVDQISCEQTPSISTRTVCDSGYHASSSGQSCIADSGDPVCGNSIKESGEQCDYGVSGNGDCPSTCSAACMLNTCGGTFPSQPACNDGLDNDGDGLVDLADTDCVDALDTSEGSGLPSVVGGIPTPLLLGGGVLLLGVYLVLGKNKRRKK